MSDSSGDARETSAEPDSTVARGSHQPTETPAVCDGAEQLAFHAWAQAQGFDLTEHPLHYLFLDAKTCAARQAWKAAIDYCRRHVV